MVERRKRTWTIIILTLNVPKGQRAVPGQVKGLSHLPSPLSGPALIEVGSDVHAALALVRGPAFLDVLFSALRLAASLALILRLGQVPLQMYPALCRCLHPPS